MSTSDPSLEAVRNDLSFVRDVVEQDSNERLPWYARLIWASYCLIGFAWLDVESRGAVKFLMFGLPVACTLEILLRQYFGKREGIRNRTRDRTEIYQAIGFVGVVLLVWTFAMQGLFVSGHAPGQMILVVVGQYLMISGLRDGWNGASFLGICLLVGALMISFFPNGVWATLGIIAAITIGFGFRWPR